MSVTKVKLADSNRLRRSYWANSLIMLLRITVLAFLGVSAIVAVRLGSLHQILVPMGIMLAVYAGLVWAVPEHKRAAYRKREILLFSIFSVLTGITVFSYVLRGTEKGAIICGALLHGFIAVALLWVNWQVMKDLFTKPKIQAKTIISGIFGYLVLGLAWTHYYVAFFTLGLSVITPTPGGQAGGYLNAYLDMLYFSFVTLTTLGYGDMHPAVMVVKLGAITEALAGQIYVVVFMASLVGMFIRDRNLANKKKNR